MSEKRIAIDDMQIKYEGLFDAKELYRVIENWIRDRGYDKKEASNSELVRPEGKFVELKLIPWKTITDYVRLYMKIKITMSNLKNVEVKRGDHLIKLNQGTVTIMFQGTVETDYEGRWDKKPTLFFIRTLFDKYIYRSYTSNYDAQITGDVEALAREIKSYLNLQKQD